MNKKIFLILILFLPAVIAGIWFLSATGDNFTVSNVSSIILTYPDGSIDEYTSDSDKEFLVEFKKNITSIEKQKVDTDVHSIYILDFQRVKGDVIYYLCLCADVKNCLAYDSDGNWYRIDKEYAKQFLSLYKVDSLYKNSDIPALTFTANGISTIINANEGIWSYLLSDESYSDNTVDKIDTYETDICVTAGEGFEFDFSVEPDWYDLKIYDGETIIYDGMLDSITDLSHSVESRQRAVITAEWYEDTTTLYHGELTYDFYFDYDIKATYSLSSDTVSNGELLYVSLLNVNNEDLEITTTISSVADLNCYPFGSGKIILVPIPSDTSAGEYRINIKSEKTLLSIPFTVKEKNFGTVNVSFVGSESASEYNSASNSFVGEISDCENIVLDGINWSNGLLTPVSKYLDGVEQYWVSSPSYGVKQDVEGTVMDTASMGIHYVKAVAAESLPIRTVATGKVAFVGNTTLYGNTVVIEHGLGFKTVYGHLDDTSLTVGQTVEAGDNVGVADPSGFSVSSTEFFFAIYVDGIFLNPYNFIVEPRSADASELSDTIEFINQLQ